MKKLLLLFLLTLSLNSYSQVKPPLTLSAGDHLQKAGLQFQTGIIISLVGSAAGYAMSTGDIDGAKTAGVVIIAASNLIGLIYEISATSHLIKAGKIFNEKKIGMTFTKNGIGIRWVIS